MNMHFFDVTDQERAYLQEKLADLQPIFHTEPLQTAEQAATIADAEVISVFVHSTVTAEVIAALPKLKLITTRSTGFDHVDLAAATAHGSIVCNVPTYGENTVAEHAFALLLSLSRHISKAIGRTKTGNFSQEGLEGFDLKGRTIGVVGSGHIGQNVIKIANGFGMDVVAFDAFPNQDLPAHLGFSYVSLEELLAQSDVISLHLPLLPTTQHIVGREQLALTKPGVIIINTARGELIELPALVEALESGKVGGAGLDVWEYEQLVIGKEALPEVVGEQVAQLDLLKRLMTRDNVVLTPHVGFDTVEAIYRILDATIQTLRAAAAGTDIPNQVHPK